MLCFNVRWVAYHIGKAIVFTENFGKGNFYIKRLDFSNMLCRNMIICTNESVSELYIAVYITEYLLAKCTDTAPS